MQTLTSLERENVIKFALEKARSDKGFLGQEEELWDWAVTHNHPDIVILLIEAGFDVNINIMAWRGMSSLSWAAYSGYIDVVTALLLAGASVNYIGNDRDPPLLLAVIFRHLDIAYLLLEKGADVNYVGKSGNTALSWAVSHAHIDMIRLLLKKGADVNYVNYANREGETALFVAVHCGHIEMVRLLLEQGADVNYVNIKGETAFFVAVSRGHIEMVRLLLEQGVDVNYVNREGETALFVAVSRGHIEMVRLLLDQGADVNHADYSLGRTTLFHALIGCCIDMVELLLNKGADINHIDGLGNSPLSLMTKNGQMSMAYVLSLYGADDALITSQAIKKEIAPFKKCCQCFYNAQKDLDEKGIISRENQAEWFALQREKLDLEQKVAGLSQRFHKKWLALFGSFSDFIYAKKIGLWVSDFSELNVKNIEYNQKKIGVNGPDIRRSAMHFLKEKGAFFSSAALLTQSINRVILDNVWVDRNGNFDCTKGFRNVWESGAFPYTVNGIVTQLFMLFVENVTNWHYKNTSLVLFLNKVKAEKRRANTAPHLSCGVLGSLVDLPTQKWAASLKIQYVSSWAIDLFLAPQEPEWREEDISKYGWDALKSEMDALKKYGYPIQKDLDYFLENLIARFQVDREYVGYSFDTNQTTRENLYAILEYIDKPRYFNVKALLDWRFEKYGIKKNEGNNSTADSKNKNGFTFINPIKKALEIAHSKGFLEGKDELWYWAITHHDADILRLLIRGGLDVNLADGLGRIPLIEAIRTSHHELIHLLVENGADVNQLDESEKTPLHAAFENNSMDQILFLLQRGADVNHMNSKRETLLLQAVCNGHIDMVRLLLKNGVAVDGSLENRSTPLAQAACNGHLDIVHFLLENGAHINHPNRYNVTPLAEAASYGHMDVVCLLLEKGANVNGWPNGSPPLFLASWNGHIDVVRLLLEQGANVNDGPNGNTPLSYAAGCGHIGIVRLLLEQGANVNSAPKNESPPLSRAVFHGKTDVVRLLLEKGADINSLFVGKYNKHLLCLAALNGYTDIACLLLKYGADINCIDDEYHGLNRTPLSWAAKKGYIEMVHLLLEHGADVNHIDRVKKTPLTLAASKGHINTVRLLLEKGANVDGCIYRMPLLRAIKHNHMNVVRLLLECGANANCMNMWGYSPLSLAACKDSLDMVRLLSLYGADDASITDNLIKKCMLPFRQWYQCLHHAQKDMDEKGVVSEKSQAEWIALHSENPTLKPEVECLSPSCYKKSLVLFGADTKTPEAHASGHPEKLREHTHVMTDAPEAKSSPPTTKRHMAKPLFLLCCILGIAALFATTMQPVVLIGSVWMGLLLLGLSKISQSGIIRLATANKGVFNHRRFRHHVEKQQFYHVHL